MKKLVIADIIGKYDKITGQPFGHYLNFFEQYSELLGKDYEVIVTASHRYKEFLSNKTNFIPLNFEIEYKLTRSKIRRLFNTTKQILNLVRVLSIKSDILLLQSPDSLLPLLPLAFFFGKKKIYIVFYKDLLQDGSALKRKAKKFLFSLYRKKISGVISGIEKVAKSYKLPYIVLPDYLKLNTAKNVKNSNMKYDVAVLGINSRSKDLIDVVNSFRNTNYKVIIAGKFVDQSFFEEVKSLATENIQIVNEYIDRKKYQEILSNSRFIALPYKPDVYKLQSSGIFYEAIYNSKPVICSDTSFFKIVREKNLGFVYTKTIAESLKIINNKDYYKEITSNIEKFTTEILIESTSKLLRFLK